MTERAYAYAPDGPVDPRSPLRRALDVLPHRAAEIAQQEILDAVAHYEQTKDDSRLLAVTVQVFAAARLEADHEFRLAMKQSDAEGQPLVEPEPIDHREYIRSLRG